MSNSANIYGNFDMHFVAGQDKIDENGIMSINSANGKESQYADFLPTWDPRVNLPPLEFFKYEDPALRADPTFPNLFPSDGKFKIRKITPKMGNEVRGVQLSQLDAKGKDELALMLAQRGVVVFRDQDFSSKGPTFAVEYGKHFGPLHIHPTSGAPKGHPELHITYRRADPGEFDRVFAHRTNAITFHSDISYELQPSGYTLFTVLEGPESGGDTVFADAVEAYNRLSPEFQKRLAGLHVLHTSEDQAQDSRGHGGVERRKPVSSIHPLVRAHPVTGEKYIYVNRPFGRRIVELKEEESDYLLNFLYNHIELSHDMQLRANWEPNTVVLWDNRKVQHTAIIDWDTPVSRHAFRVTVQAERPVENLIDLNKEHNDIDTVKEVLKRVVH